MERDKVSKWGCLCPKILEGGINPKILEGGGGKKPNKPPYSYCQERIFKNSHYKGTLSSIE